MREECIQISMQRSENYGLISTHNLKIAAVVTVVCLAQSNSLLIFTNQCTPRFKIFTLKWYELVYLVVVCTIDADGNTN